jgi:acylglycerol lipase
MPEPNSSLFTASDGYPFHLTRWPARGSARGRVVVLHGVQSHGGWYHNLGTTLAERGYDTTFPDRRGSGRNQLDRGHVSSYRRLLEDIAELLRSIREQEPRLPLALAGISWGGKLAVITSAQHPALVDALALICPGLHARVDPSRAERMRIAWAFFTDRRRHFPIPLADPALFTADPEGQSFIATDPMTLRSASASLLAASRFIDRRVRAARSHVHQPALLMLAGEDRIVDNTLTRRYFDGLPSERKRIIEYPEGNHTLEFDPDPSRYALDLADWLDINLGPRVRSTTS